MSLFSKRKKLVVSGCSYTDNYARQEKIKEFPLWGELLAEKLDMDLINLGRCGYGNKAIYTSLAETILPRKDIGLCVAMWSEVQRVCLFRSGVYVCFHPDRRTLDAEWHDQFYNPPTKNPKKSSVRYEVSKVLIDNSFDDMESDTLESLGYMYSFQNLCEVNNIPYLQIQGCPPLMNKEESKNNKQYKDFCNYIIESPYVDKMKKTFIGWPLDSRIGGYSIDSKLEEDHRISAEDTHPNAKGHKFIAGVLYNEYEKSYS